MHYFEFCLVGKRQGIVRFLINHNMQLFVCFEILKFTLILPFHQPTYSTYVQHFTNVFWLQRHRKTLLPGRPHQWIPPFLDYPSEQDSRFDSHYADHGQYDEQYPDEQYHQGHEFERNLEESDHYQESCYDNEPADETIINNTTPIQTVSADVLFGNAEQRTRPTHVSFFHNLVACAACVINQVHQYHTQAYLY